MLSTDKQLLLSGFLGKLPEHVAARLAKAVEVDRLIGGTSLPHDMILRALRPQLRQGPDRTLRMQTPQRFFCRPFEDILVGSERSIKQKGRITRDSIEAVWNWLASDLMAVRHRIIVEALRDAILHARESEIEERCVELWSEAAAVLKPELATEKKKAFAAKKLGGMALAEDAAEMALLLEAAPKIAELQGRLPKPIVNLSEDDLVFLRDCFEHWSDSDPDLAPYVPLIVMGRLERRWEALRLVGALTRKSDDTLISNTDLGVVGELLFGDLDVYVKKIQAIRPMDFDDAETLLGNLAGFAELSSGIVKEFGIRRDGKWGHRLTKDRGAVAQVMEDLLERAPKEILGALPAAKMGGFGKSPKPLDFSRAPDPERAAKAMRYAQLMRHAKPFAVAAAFSAKLSETIDETTNVLRTHTEDILRELRAAAPETRGIVDLHWAQTLELCALVLGEEETGLLRRRARVPAPA
ncbi:MAG TPA: hypothetical protein VGM72_07605 [Micropepsaceae bacterium]|jgi:hypothetical protein